MLVYGIPNCNTVKKALDWLKANQIEFEFHDYKKKGISKAKLEAWAAELGWEALLNKKGTTWRMLPQDVQAGITSKERAFELMIEKPSLIKRPVVESKPLLLGFDEQLYAKNLNK
jgi:Spx/MgsR family transcriptional regulator